MNARNPPEEEEVPGSAVRAGVRAFMEKVAQSYGLPPELVMPTPCLYASLRGKYPTLALDHASALEVALVHSWDLVRESPTYIAGTGTGTVALSTILVDAIDLMAQYTVEVAESRDQKQKRIDRVQQLNTAYSGRSNKGRKYR